MNHLQQSVFVILGAVAIGLSFTCPAPAESDETARYRAIDRLGYESENPSDAAPRLETMLTSDDSQVRWRAARALGLLGESAAATSPKLVKLLSDNDPVVQAHASIALGRIGDKSEATLEALISKVTSPDERVSRAAIQTLRLLEASPEKLAGALEQVLASDNHAVMSHALDAIVSRGSEATPFLNAALAKEKSAHWAAVAIGEIGPDAAGTTDALANLIGRTTDPQTLQLALVAIAKIGPAAEEASSAVQQVAKMTQEDGARIAACYALGAIGDESATDLLKQLASTGGPFQEMVCGWAVAKLHPNDPAAMGHAIELLVKGLESDRLELRDAAAVGLKSLDASPEQVAPVLISAVKSATPEQRSHIAFALASLGPEVVPAATKMLADPDLRDIGIEVLGRLGKDAAEGVEDLTKCLAADADDCVARAQYALASIGAEAGSAAQQVAENLSSDVEEVRHSALFALRQFGAEAQEAAEPLHEFMESTNDQFEQYATAWALAKMKLDAHLLEEVTESLQSALDSADEQVRLETIAAISDLGPAGAVFRENLQKLAKDDPSPEVRAAAEEASDGASE